jgi:hypothetical protein
MAAEEQMLDDRCKPVTNALRPLVCLFRDTNRQGSKVVGYTEG